MNETKGNNAVVYARVQEHYEYLISAGYDIVFTALQGSQNYGLDEYSQEYQSDVDTKSVILPSLDSIVRGKTPISTTIVLSNNEHAEVKDIRVMFEMFKKENISYIELLYSDYIIFNPKYEDMIKPIFEKRDEIVNADITQFLRCIAGMAYEKDKALCHPYPGIIDKINKYGYDGKQLSHCYRLLIFIRDFAQGKTIAQCFKPDPKQRKIMMDYKKQLNGNGLPQPKELAIGFSRFYCDEIKQWKDDLIKNNDYTVDCLRILDDIAAQIIKYKIRKEINAEMEEFKYFSKEEQEAEARVISANAVASKDNIYDYYEEENDTNETK